MRGFRLQDDGPGMNELFYDLQIEQQQEHAASEWSNEQIRSGVINAAAFLDCSNHPNASEWASACRLAANIIQQIKEAK